MTYAPTTPPVPSLLDDDVHVDLRRALRRALDQRGTVPGPDLWRMLVDDLGLAALLVPEHLGGAGATLRDVAVVMTELGRAVAPVPYLASAVLATTALVPAADAGGVGGAAATAALRRLLDGQVGALVVPATSSPVEAHTPTVTAAGSRLTGGVDVVLGADVAQLFVVPATTERGVALFVVEPGAAGVSVDRLVSADETRPVSRVCLAGAEGIAVAEAPQAAALVTAALVAGAVALTAEAVGLAEWAVDASVAHLTTRHQFGRPLGSYQSLRHRAAQMWIDTGQCRAISTYAAACAADDLDDRHIALAIAKPFATSHALSIVESCLQLHGGIGFTWDSGVHLRLKRAMTATVLLGTEESHHLALGRLVDLAPPPPSSLTLTATTSGEPHED